MDELISQLITTLVGLGLLAGGYLLWLLTGVVNSAFNTKTWSWQKMAIDVSKALLIGVVILALVALSNGLEWYAGLLGFDISAFTSGMSTVAMLGGIVAGVATYYGRAMKNALNYFKLHTTAKQIEGTTPNYAVVAESTLEIVNGIVTAISTPPEVIGAQEEFEIEGGQGMAYSVPIDTYDRFRNAVIGKGYDIDGAYGYQCWDGCALLWQQLGKSLVTGNGCASGCWSLKRDFNKNDQFELITNKTQILRGDVLVFSAGQYGHIGFADEDYNNANCIKLLGQNQGGTPVGAAGGAGFNVINMSLASFMGAFRYKGWANNKTAQNAEKITENSKNVEPSASTDFKKGDKVEVLRYVDVNGTNLLRLQTTPYTVFQARKSDRTAVLKSDDGGIYARMSFDNIKKVN